MARKHCENRMTLTSRFEEVGRAEAEVLRAAQAYGYDEAACFAIKLSLEEALTNAIKHGNRFAPDKRVKLEYRIDDRELLVKVCDEGGGFKPGRVPDPTLDENLEKPHGRGIMLMKAYMTEVAFSPDGRCVTMTRRRNDHHAPGA